MPDYYRILQIPGNASLLEIKKAYRRLAHDYHPDVSDLPDARERFIEINEAYEYLSNKIRLESELKNIRENDLNDDAQSTIDAWLLQEKERMRARARKYANMRYNDYRRTNEYRATAILSGYLRYAALFFGVIVLFGAIYGTWSQWVANSSFINASYIISAFFIGALGVVMISYALNMIRKAMKEQKEMHNNK